MPTINSNVNMVHIKARFIINNQSCATFWTFRNSVYDHETWSSNQVNIEADVEVTNMNSIYFWEYPSASRYNANFYLDIFEMYFYKK